MIITKNITKKCANFTAIENLSLKVKEGEILCLLGANGAGKSTIINILLNFIILNLISSIFIGLYFLKQNL